MLVLDNASGDGSAEAVREWNAGPEGLGERLRLIALDRRRGKAENDSRAPRRGAGRVVPAPERGLRASPRAPSRRLLAAVEGEPEGRGGRGAAPGRGRLALGMRVAPSRRRHGPRPGALPPPRLRHPERRAPRPARSAGCSRRRCSSAARRRREVGYLDPDFFVYSDETDFQKRLHDAGWEVLYVPGAEAVHHEQLTNDRVAGRRRLVEFHRNRDLYMRKHHGAASAARGARPHRVDLRGARARRAGPSGAGRRVVLAPRPPGAEPQGRGDPRGGRRAERAPRPRGAEGET